MNRSLQVFLQLIPLDALKRITLKTLPSLLQAVKDFLHVLQRILYRVCSGGVLGASLSMPRTHVTFCAPFFLDLPMAVSLLNLSAAELCYHGGTHVTVKTEML